METTNRRTYEEGVEDGYAESQETIDSLTLIVANLRADLSEIKEGLQAMADAI